MRPKSKDSYTKVMIKNNIGMLPKKKKENDLNDMTFYFLIKFLLYNFDLEKREKKKTY